MRRSRVLLTVGALAGLGIGALSLGRSSAFTQSAALGMTAPGHEPITVEGGHLAGGWFREPGHNEVTGEHNSCRTCDQYNTNNSKLWSAVMGQRWVDIGGYSVVTSTKCFNATMQDSDQAQPKHALRKKCDVGIDGLRRTHQATVAVIRDRFMRAVHAKDDMIWFQDGGVISLKFKANHPEFLLGQAIHPLQDSFSQEHAVRSGDWHTISDLKTYVDTKSHSHAESHAEYKFPEDHYKFKPGIGSLHFPNEKHGDYAFKTLGARSWHEMKPSAQAAAHATADLMKAYEAARLAPAQADRLFAQFEATWLRLAPQGEALAAVAADPACHPGGADYGSGASNDSTWKTTEAERQTCLREAGVEHDNAPTGGALALYGVEPKYCRGNCSEDALGHMRDAVTRAAHAAEHALSDVASFFAHIAQAVEDFFNHFWHSYDRCYGESGDFGRRGGDHYMSAAHQKADHFWAELGDAIDMLNLADRHRAVDDQWNRVKAGILGQEGGTRNATCSRVRGWFTKGSSKDKGEHNCRSNFDAHTVGLSADLDHLYQLHITRGLPPAPPPPAPPVHAAVPVRPGALASLAHGALSSHHENNIAALAGHYKNELTACRQAAGANSSHCDLRANARLAILGQAPPPPPHETPDQMRDRFYAEYHACLQSPMVRFHNLGRTEELCKEKYDREMAENHLKPRSPSDEPPGTGPHVEK